MALWVSWVSQCVCVCNGLQSTKQKEWIISSVCHILNRMSNQFLWDFLLSCPTNITRCSCVSIFRFTFDKLKDKRWNVTICWNIYSTTIWNISKLNNNGTFRRSALNLMNFALVLNWRRVITTGNFNNIRSSAITLQVAMNNELEKTRTIG